MWPSIWHSSSENSIQHGHNLSDHNSQHEQNLSNNIERLVKLIQHLTQAEFIRSQHLTWAEVCVKEVSRLLSTSIYFIQKLYTCIFNEHPMTELFKSQTLLQLFLFITPLLIGFCLKIFLLLNQDKQDKQED